MKSKKNILAAIAAMSVMASAMSLNAFAAEDAETTEEAVAITAVAEDVEEEDAAEEAVEVEAPELVVPDAELDETEKPVPPEPPVILDVTEFIDQIRTFIDANSIDILTDTILENWDQIEKVDVHFHANEKPEPPVAPEDAEKPEVDEEAEAEEAEDAEDVEKPTKPLGPVHLELTDLFMQFRDKVDLSKIDFIDEDTMEKILNAKDVHADVHFVNPNKPEPPVAPEDGELPTPPVAPEDGELPTPPAPPVPPEGPVHEHLGPKEREALKAAEAEAEESTEAVAEETTEAVAEETTEADAE